MGRQKAGKQVNCWSLGIQPGWLGLVMEPPSYFLPRIPAYLSNLTESDSRRISLPSILSK